jgi:hypothetical protein
MPKWVDESFVSFDDTTREILTRLGLSVVSDDSPCDATLTLNLNCEAFAARYTRVGTFYGGGQVKGQLILASAGQVPCTFPISGYSPLPDYISSEAEERPNPWDFPFENLTFEPIVNGLYSIWGPQVLVWSMDLTPPGEYISWEERFDVIGPVEEVVTALIYALQHESRGLRINAARLLAGFAPEAEKAIPFLTLSLNDPDVIDSCIFALEVFGPKAMSAVPELINIIDDDEIHPHEQNSAIDALVAITGQDYGKDVSSWQQWWDDQQ